MSLARSCFVVPSIPSPLTPPSHFSGHGGISLTGIITRVKILCLVPVQGGSVRQVFAFVVLVACIRLWLAFHTVPIGLSVSEAHGHDINRNVKGIEEPWLDAMEGILSGPRGVHQDSRPGTATFQLDRR
jgi:hypothetical protein